MYRVTSALLHNPVTFWASSRVWPRNLSRAVSITGISGGFEEFKGVAGVQEYRSTGVQEYRSTGVQELQEFRSSGGRAGAFDQSLITNHLSPLLFHPVPFASVASLARGLFRLEQTIAQLAPEVFRALRISGNERQIDFVILSWGKDQAGSLRSLGDSAYHQRILREISSKSQAAFREHPFFDAFG
jgi:hypothetical protein